MWLSQTNRLLHLEYCSEKKKTKTSKSGNHQIHNKINKQKSLFSKNNAKLITVPFIVYKD